MRRPLRVFIFFFVASCGKNQPGKPLTRGCQRHSDDPPSPLSCPSTTAADVLGRAIQSVLEQTLKDFELIVVDDGSTDASVAVAKSFADPRIRIIELGQNRGGNAARERRRPRAPRGR